MENDRGQNYSSFCCPTCHIETERSCCKCCPSYKKDQEELGEECPLKKDQSSECKIGGNWKSSGFRALIFCLLLLFLAIIGAILLNFVFTKKITVAVPTNGVDGKHQQIFVPPPSPPPKNIVHEHIRAEKHGAVATDCADCSRIGTDLLREGGNAVDAAVAAAICIAVVAPHKSGLGGGGKMMIYSHRDRMNPLVVDFVNNTNAGIFATAMVRLPGFLRGLEFAQSMRGNLPWMRIIEPAAKLAEDGFIVSEELANEIGKSVENGMIFGHLRAGEKLRLPVLAETLVTVGRLGCDAFYNGDLSKKVLRDAVIKDELLHQLASYEPKVIESTKTIFHNHAIYLPYDASIFRSIIEELEGLKISDETSSSLEAEIQVARVIVQKVGENVRLLKNLEQEKYSVVVAMDPHDTYVSIVTGLSAPLGLAHMSGAGFLLDGVSTENRLDTLTPIIFVHEKRVCSLRGVFGTDDPAIFTQILYNLIPRSLNVSTAVENPRFYVLSDGIAMENDEIHFMDPNLRLQLESLIPVSGKNLREISKSVNAITKHEETLASHSDSRGDGKASRMFFGRESSRGFSNFIGDEN